MAPPDADGSDAVRVLPPEEWERVGRALEKHLAQSGEYGYTLDLRRQDASLDPAMDFLVNVKAGHCERFASALALMLRSQGVPSRVVVGFRGAADQGNGVYMDTHQGSPESGRLVVADSDSPFPFARRRP